MKEGIEKPEIQDLLENDIAPSVAKIILSALGGMPVVGSLIGAVGTAWSEHDQRQYQKLLVSWLKLQEEEMIEFGHTLAEVLLKIDQTDELVSQRIQSQDYLSLVKRCIHDLNTAESNNKRALIRNLLVNASAVEQLCSDDVIRMFIKWIDTYNEPHFRIIREINREPGLTRYEIWERIHGSKVREDSAEADLFKLLVHELSLGMIIRQYREKDTNGNFKKQPIKRPIVRKATHDRLLTSAFDDDKKYHLTELGSWFVHYTMNEEFIKIN